MQATIQKLVLLVAFLRTSQARLGWLRVLIPTRRRDGAVSAFGVKPWRYRGGDAGGVNSDNEDDNNAHPTDSEQVVETDVPFEPTITPKRKSPKKLRRTSEMVWDLRRRSGVGENDESIEMRELISTRAREYTEDLRLAVASGESKLPHPRKLLHYLAPKVPAIKQSPDVNLRIHSARSDMDSGLAACIIGVLAHACEMYDQEMLKRSNLTGEKMTSAAPELTTDRRFEQLIECVLSGVSIKKRKREFLSRRLEENCEDGADIEEILDEEDVQEDEGLKIRDTCRAVWGIAVLGAHHLDTLGGEKVLDLLLALSLRGREVLLARLQNLRQDDLLSEHWMSNFSPEERLNELAEELAEDAVSCMWAFACVKACTGQTSTALFETCCSILCQDPISMRKRAQDGEVRNIGSSDVIHRLAHSEGRNEPQDDDGGGGSGGSDEEEDESSEPIGKDAFLDWLSPTETNDVLWALALHGSSNQTSISDEINLSDTASALREIAFDRILDWLEEDLERSADPFQKIQESGQVKISSFTDEDQVMTVEVVDASALLASKNDSQVDLDGVTVENLPVENITLTSESRSSSGEVQEIQVVDAAQLLASQHTDESREFVSEKVVMRASTSDAHSSASRDVVSDTSDDNGEENRESTNRNLSPLFNTHDLASMAWSVTELRDSLRIRVVGIIVELLSRSGKASIDKVSSSDLSNLAWAISKYQNDMMHEQSSRSSLVALSVVQWVAHSALEKVLQSLPIDSTDQPNALEAFQPPELGRLVWAIACTKSSFSNISHSMKYDPKIVELAQMALQTAAKHLALFDTEDLLRIIWAFLELCEDHTGSLGLDSIPALGRVLSTVEQSLHRWERGECRLAPSEDHTAMSGSVFSSFFGRPRKNLPAVEYVFGENDDDYGDALAHILEKSRRPKLRDLSVDPSTLCKAACGFQRLAKRRTLMRGGWTLTRVALRLLTSRDARLMRECSMNDIVRICEAAALTDAGGHGRELLLGFFARKLLQVLNQSMEEGRTDILFNLSEASIADLSTLLWSLGELGARHSLPTSGEASELAHKKMRLVFDSAFLSKDDVKSLNTESSIKLFRGLVLMRFFDTDRRFLLCVLKEVESRSKRLKTGEDICNLAETVGLLRYSLKARTSIQSNSDSSSDIQSEMSSQNTNDETNTAEPTEKNDTSLPEDEQAIDGELWEGSGRILRGIAERVLECKRALTASEIRRILVVYSFLPFQADDLIKELDPEVSERILKIKNSFGQSLEQRIEMAQSQSNEINKTLFEDSNNSAFSSLKSGFMSLFQSVSENEENDEVPREIKLTEDLTTLAQQLTESTARVSSKVHEWSMGSRTSLDTLMKRVDESSLFEYGRCQELIAHYHRVEFSTGTFRSRYDKERRKDIAKRVLSRLLP